MQHGECVAALDAGGTSFKCALVTGDGAILSSWAVPTTTADESEVCVRLDLMVPVENDSHELLLVGCG